MIDDAMNDIVRLKESRREELSRVGLFALMLVMAFVGTLELIRSGTATACVNLAGQLRYRSLMVRQLALDGNWVEAQSQMATMKELRATVAGDFPAAVARTDASFHALEQAATPGSIPAVTVVFRHVHDADELTTAVGHQGQSELMVALSAGSIAVLALLAAFVLQHRMVVRLRLAQVTLGDLAARDPLTGMPNRRTLFDELKRAVADAQRHGQPLCVAVIDLDRFKMVNDRYGHQMGDRVLIHFADLASNQLRDGDLFARFGGEEFALVLNHCDLQGGVRLADRLRSAFADSPLGAVATTCSIGVAEAQPGETVEELVGRADFALLRAKRDGRNRVFAAKAERVNLASA
jgi:diguanylate cyclase (GGDEF)-like protein